MKLAGWRFKAIKERWWTSKFTKDVRAGIKVNLWLQRMSLTSRIVQLVKGKICKKDWSNKVKIQEQPP